ncbi:proteoglycan 4b isoform X2 [Hypomesus transpacificus]|uniref:proteoglycan 4b isoform X2 n=1 Tax=Hypomesus transpacificus TaxID=137520 RepID=UPI001F07E9DC|nr:proteoglycan 4b isoform X2 [Hypomesus transpacificus]
MTVSVLSAILLLACNVPSSVAQSSCSGRCGEEYYRGFMCHCDYECIVHDECCKDYISQCTTKDSCKGRCGEVFKRGRGCSCDADCQQFNQCCPDFKDNCDPEDSQAQPAEQPEETPINSNVEEDQDLPESEFNPLTPEDSQDPYDDVIGETYPNIPTDTGPEVPPIPEASSGYEPSPSDLPETVPSEPSLTQTTPWVDSQDDPEQEATAEETYTGQPGDQEGDSGPSDGLPTQTVPDGEADSPSDLEGQPDPTLPGSPSAQPNSEPQTSPSPAESDAQPDGQDKPQPDTQDVDNESLTNDSESPVPDPESAGDLIPTTASPPTSPGPTKNPPSPDDSEPSPASPNSTTPSTNSLVPEPTTLASEQEASNDAPTATTVSSSEPQVSKGTSSTPVSEDTEPKPSSETKGQDESMTTTATSVKEGDEAAVEETSTDPMKFILTPAKPAPAQPAPAKPTSKPKPKPTKPSSDLGTYNPRDYQSDDNNNTNLCTGRPAGATTTLRNGTVVVFRGHYFWVLDSFRNPGPARGITDVWGVPSPIDTVFTRCNCQGKTYILKGPQYWRFENGMVDQGYPKLVSTGFDGLQGQITAALSVPEYRRRGEAVYFFKSGGLVQRYSYKQGTSPTCGKKVQYAVYGARNRVARQAASPLGPAINIRVTWKGFPSTVTSAVSIPNRRQAEGYSYYVFSRSKYYNVKMEDRPVLATPMSLSPKKNSAKDFFNCPKTV